MLLLEGDLSLGGSPGLGLRHVEGAAFPACKVDSKGKDGEEMSPSFFFFFTLMLIYFIIIKKITPSSQ